MIKEYMITVLAFLFVLMVAFFSFTVGYCKGAVDMLIFVYEEPENERSISSDPVSNPDLLGV